MQGSGFRVQGLGFRVLIWVLGFRVEEPDFGALLHRKWTKSDQYKKEWRARGAVEQDKLKKSQ